MPRRKRKPSKWTSSNESSSDEIKFTSSDEDENKTNQSESKTSGSSGDKPNADDEGKASSGEGKTQDTDSLSKTLLQRVTFRMGGTRKQTEKPPPARKNDFSIGQKVWINQRNNKKLARVLSVRVDGVTVDVILQNGQIGSHIPITLLEPTAIGSDKWIQSVVQTFNEYDQSNSGMISRSDLERFFSEIGFPASISFDRSRWWTTEVSRLVTGHATKLNVPPGFISLETFTECVMRCFPGFPPDSMK